MQIIKTTNKNSIIRVKTQKSKDKFYTINEGKCMYVNVCTYIILYRCLPKIIMLLIFIVILYYLYKMHQPTLISIVNAMVLTYKYI